MCTQGSSDQGETRNKRVRRSKKVCFCNRSIDRSDIENLCIKRVIKLKQKKISSHQENVGDDILLIRFRLENYKYYFLYKQECIPPVPIITKKKKSLVKLLIFPLILHPWIRICIRNTDPDPQTEMNADPTGSGSKSGSSSLNS